MRRFESPYPRTRWRQVGVYNLERHSIFWDTGTERVLEYSVPESYHGKFQDGQEVVFDGIPLRKRDGSRLLYARNIDVMKSSPLS